MKRIFWIILALVLVTLACARISGEPPEETAPAPAASEASPDVASPKPSPDPPTATSPPLVEPDPESIPAAGWPEPRLPEAKLSRTAVSALEQATFALLAETNFIANDPVALAIALKGAAQPEPAPTSPQVVYEVGQTETFWISNTDTIEWSEVEFKLERITEHAYFWFDTRFDIGQARIDIAAADFDEMFEADRAVYGEYESLGVDGDPRVHVLHASPRAICGSAECGLLGYFPTTHTLPDEINEFSNEMELFVINISRTIGGDDYNSTMAHEFRHMIEHFYDRHDDDWEVEGTATVAQILVGDLLGPKARADGFVQNTDLQLNAWSQGSTNAHYGKGYVMSRYLLDRFGPDFYSTWVQHPDRAFFAIDAVLDQYDYEESALDVWVDFTAAVTLIGQDNVPAPFAFADNFHSNAPRTTDLRDFPLDWSDTVRQHGFDIYELIGAGSVQIDFTGTTKVNVIEDVLPASGEYMWWSGRANQSDMHLTHEFDLTEVASATLNYHVNYSIEDAYDFAYTLISTDGGQTWEALVGQQMQGTEREHDPGHIALTERFYTGDSAGWYPESIDLSPYAGQVVQIRFQYITDAIYTDPGLQVDNISIPEIGFYDDVETLADGWVAQGFVRVSAYVAQEFHVTLITFEDGAPVVTRIELDETNFASFAAPLDTKAYLVVAASTPLVMTPASYDISISQ